jgi:ribonuclease HII
VTGRTPRASAIPITAALDHEQRCSAAGFRAIVGLDEAGRGAWAGPVAAGAVCLPLHRADLSTILAGVNDSKQLTPGQRETLAVTICQTAVAWGVGMAGAAEVDAYGIVPATKLAMARAIDAMSAQTAGFAPDCLLLDSMRWPECPFPCSQERILKGDQNALTIAAASILAKTHRDALMRELDGQFPGYGLALHKGYGTSVHAAALRRLGVTPLHRRSFAPIRALLTVESESD